MRRGAGGPGGGAPGSVLGPASQKYDDTEESR